MQELQPYMYEPLSYKNHQIRILELQPGSDDEQLREYLSIVDMDGKPEYECLSYVWGDATPRHMLRIHQDKMLMIGDNVHRALIGLRERNKHVKIWIDAICINQNDIKERNHQVQNMFCVYRNSASVRAWLGREHEECDIALENILGENENIVSARLEADNDQL